MMPEIRPPHEVLQIPPDAPREAIEAAYEHARRLIDGDTMALYGMFDDGSADRLRKDLDAAYSTLVRRAMRAPAKAPVPADHARAHVEAEVSPAKPAPSLHVAPREPSLQAAPQTPRPAPAQPTQRRPAVRTRLCGPRAEPLAEPLTGVLLRRLREEASATVEEVCDLTKINRRYIVALEAEDFEQLPASVYVRGFIGEYARVLGLGQNEAAAYLASYRAWAQAHI